MKINKLDSDIVKMQAYTRIMRRVCDGFSEISELDNKRKKVLFHTYVRFLGLVDAEVNPENYMQIYFFAAKICETLTPRDITEIFPITKQYDGTRYEIKDYYHTRDMIEKFGIDTPLGENVDHFLFDYQNRHIEDFIIESMTAMNAIRRSQGKKDMILKFFEIAKFKEGIDTQIIVDKLQSGIGGLEWIVLQTVVDNERKHMLEEAYKEYDSVSGFLEIAKLALQDPDKDVNEFIVLRDLFTHLALLRERDYDSYFVLLKWLTEKEEA